MARLQPEDVRRVAALASLRLTEDEVRDFGADLESILDYVEVLGAVDTAGVEPTSLPIPFPTPLRDDVGETPLSTEQALANAPARAGTAFAVPVVIDED